MRGVKFKLFLSIGLGILSVLMIIYFSIFIRNFYAKTNDILYKLNILEKYEREINYYLLYSSLFLYYNNDKISNSLKKSEKVASSLIKDKFFKKHYKASYKNFLEYKRLFNKKRMLIYEFLKYNAPFKNAILYISEDIKYISIPPERVEDIFSLISSLFLSKSFLDDKFVKELSLSKFKFLLNAKNPYNSSLFRNIKIFLEYFPYYKSYLNRVLKVKTLYYLDKSLMDFRKCLDKNVKIFSLLSLFLIGYIALIMGFFIVTLIKLKSSIYKMEQMLIIDSVTGLYNRYKFNLDIKRKRGVVVVFNIDKFKHLNDYYGSEFGDKVLREVGRTLKEFFQRVDRGIEVYRVGADDFAVILDKRDDIEKLVKEAIEYVENKEFKIGNISLSLSLSGGISFDGDLEHADMALKLVKQEMDKKIEIFDGKMNEKFKNILHITKVLKEAIDNEKIVLFYQPIVDSNFRIIKYEVLCRVEIDGKLETIAKYLDILKDMKLYYKVTLIILKKSLFVLKAHPNVNLSINIASEDIKNPTIYSFIVNNFKDSGIAKRVTFEILESAIRDYDDVYAFIKEMEKFGIEFAIDDFGSGYSNFSRVLRLKVKYLKIDGSLIKNLDKDRDSRLVVETIVTFAKKSNIKTIAEFIHSKEVFEVAKEIGVDYFQGFYIGKPSEKFIENVKKM